MSMLDFFGRIEAERGEVADVQLDDLVAFVLHLLGAHQHRAADVVADVGELGGLADRTRRGGSARLGLDHRFGGCRRELEGLHRFHASPS
jgi:hypothetical protein